MIDNLADFYNVIEGEVTRNGMRYLKCANVNDSKHLFNPIDFEHIQSLRDRERSNSREDRMGTSNLT